MVNELTGWSEMKSLKLSRFLVAGLFFLLIVVLFTAHIIADWFSIISVGEGFIKSERLDIVVTVMIYICDIFAITAVVALNKLLSNISKEEVFTEQNTKCLRIISWCIVFAGITFIVFSLWRYEFLFAAFFAMFLGLVMRVLKNVFEKAVELKSENDFTI